MTREERNEAIEFFKKVKEKEVNGARYSRLAIEALEHKPCEDIGEVSDGYHTFNQLYHQRAVLFATIVNQNKDKSWKSFKHSDGDYCFDSNGEWFIVGIDTPQGSYTYHYAKDYWDMFNCEELECGKEWDGHTEEDVTRLLSLEQELCEDAISRQDAIRIAEQGQIQGYEWQFKKLIKLPPVSSSENLNKWIPVSKRLPEKNMACLVAVGKLNFTEMAMYSNLMGTIDHRIFYQGDVGHDNFEDITEYVKAWMPLPESYKASPTGEEVEE